MYTCTFVDKCISAYLNGRIAYSQCTGTYFFLPDWHYISIKILHFLWVTQVSWYCFHSFPMFGVSSFCMNVVWEVGTILAVGVLGLGRFIYLQTFWLIFYSYGTHVAYIRVTKLLLHSSFQILKFVVFRFLFLACHLSSLSAYVAIDSRGQWMHCLHLHSQHVTILHHTTGHNVTLSWSRVPASKTLCYGS